MFKWKDRNRRAVGTGGGYAPSASEANSRTSTASPEVSPVLPQSRLPSETLPVRQPNASDSWNVHRDANGPASLSEDTFQELLSSGKLKENVLRLRHGNPTSLYGNEPATTEAKAAPERKLYSGKSDLIQPDVSKAFEWARPTQDPSLLPEHKPQGYQTTPAPSLLPERKLQDYYESDGKHFNLSSEKIEAADSATSQSWNGPRTNQAPLATPEHRSRESRSKSRSKSRTRKLRFSDKIDVAYADVEEDESRNTRAPSMQTGQKSPVPQPGGKVQKLSDAIRQACPGWSEKTIAAAEEKLVLVNVCCVAELADALVEGGKSSLNNQLLAAGLKAFSQETLVALRKTLKVEMEDPKMLLDQDLLNVLQRAFPEWSAKSQAAVQEKLALVGAMNMSDLAGMLTKNELNKRLLHAGQKVFTEDTLAVLRQAVLGVDQDLRDELSALFPNWSAKATQAVEEKLVVVGASSITGLRRLLACRGKYGLNWKLQEVGRGIFTDKSLKTMRSAFAVPDVPALPVEPEVHQVLCAACPGWSDLALEAAEEKLANVGATSVSELTRLLYGSAQDGLNAVLQEAGLKTFSRETLIELRTTLGIIDKALHVFLRDSCPSWTAAELEAAEHKLALVGVRDTNALSTSIAATGSNSLNSKLVHAGLITFKRATLCIWCAALQIDIALPDNEE